MKKVYFLLVLMLMFLLVGCTHPEEKQRLMQEKLDNIFSQGDTRAYFCHATIESETGSEEMEIKAGGKRMLVTLYEQDKKPTQDVYIVAEDNYEYMVNISEDELTADVTYNTYMGTMRYVIDDIFYYYMDDFESMWDVLTENVRVEKGNIICQPHDSYKQGEFKLTNEGFKFFCTFEFEYGGEAPETIKIELEVSDIGTNKKMDNVEQRVLDAVAQVSDQDRAFSKLSWVFSAENARATGTGTIDGVEFPLLGAVSGGDMVCTVDDNLVAVVLLENDKIAYIRKINGGTMYGRNTPLWSTRLGSLVKMSWRWSISSSDFALKSGTTDTLVLTEEGKANEDFDFYTTLEIVCKENSIEVYAELSSGLADKIVMTIEVVEEPFKVQFPQKVMDELEEHNDHAINQ